MIVVIGRVATDAGQRDELVRVGEAVARASRDEAGCIAYAMHACTEDENRFVFVEEWADQAALDAHFATAHVAEFMSAIRPLLTAAPDVKFHTVEATVDIQELGGSG